MFNVDVLGDEGKPACRRCIDGGFDCQYGTKLSFLEKNAMTVVNPEKPKESSYSTLRVSLCLKTSLDCYAKVTTKIWSSCSLLSLSLQHQGQVYDSKRTTHRRWIQTEQALSSQLNQHSREKASLMNPPSSLNLPAHHLKTSSRQLRKHNLGISPFQNLSYTHNLRNS